MDNQRRIPVTLDFNRWAPDFRTDWNDYLCALQDLASVLDLKNIPTIEEFNFLHRVLMESSMTASEELNRLEQEGP